MANRTTLPRTSRYDPNYVLTQDDARLVAAPFAPAYDRNLMTIDVLSPMFDTLPAHAAAAGPVVDLPDVVDVSDVDIADQLRDNVHLDDGNPSVGTDAFFLQYEDRSENSSERNSSIDVIAANDERAIVDNLVAKNLGRVPMDDDIPLAAGINDAEEDEERGSPLFHRVFKETYEGEETK